MASNPTSNQSNSGKQGTGFGAMDPQKQRDIASQGGHASHGGKGSTSADKGSASNRNTTDKTSSDSNPSRGTGGVQGGTPEQHAEAGRQSHKNAGKM